MYSCSLHRACMDGRTSGETNDEPRSVNGKVKVVYDLLYKKKRNVSTTGFGSTMRPRTGTIFSTCFPMAIA